MISALARLCLCLCSLLWSVSCSEAVDIKAVGLVTKLSAAKRDWDGPQTGAKAEAGRKVVVLAADMGNGGIRAMVDGIREAAAAVHWTVVILDGHGIADTRSKNAVAAVKMAPDGVVIAGFDPIEQMLALDPLRDANVPFVGWHASASAHISQSDSLFANVTTDPDEVAVAAAAWPFLKAAEPQKVVIFTDSTYEIALAKARTMKKTVESLGGQVIDWVDLPIAQADRRMPAVVAQLLKRHPGGWTTSLAINDVYFDHLGAALAAAGIDAAHGPVNVSAGDGSESAYQRIGAGQYQAATVAEPLNLQGWQVIDELVRAMAGERPSGYVAPPFLFTADTLPAASGALHVFDPDNGYRQAYLRIWGVR